MLRRIPWMLFVALPWGCTSAQQSHLSDSPRNDDRITDLAGRWRGRLSLYSAEINDLVMELQLRHAGTERVGRAEIEITDEPGELHRYVIDLSWDQDGPSVVIDIGEDDPDGSPGLTFSGELVGETQIDGRLNGWGIRNARFTLARQVR